MKIEADNLKQRIAIKWTHFIGIFIFIVISVWFYEFWLFSEKEKLSFFHNPQIGDVYKFENNERNFSTFKIVQIEKDNSVWVRYNKETVSRRKYVNATITDSLFSEKKTKIPFKKLKKMFYNNKIYDINR